VLNINLGFLPQIGFILLQVSKKWLSINTSKFDDSILYCGSAWEYEVKRKEILTHLVTKLSIFNFTWGGFETVVKVIAPSGISIEQAKKLGRKNEIVDRAIYFLKQEYDPMPLVPLYDETVAKLRLMLKEHPGYFELGKRFKEDEITSISGIGLHIVRMIRNDFAHGSADLPIPSDWGEKGSAISLSEQLNLDIIDTSSRILLLTIQMLLLAHYKQQDFTVDILKDDEGMPIYDDIKVVLRVLHLSDFKTNQNQMKLIT